MKPVSNNCAAKEILVLLLSLIREGCTILSSQVEFIAIIIILGIIIGSTEILFEMVHEYNQLKLQL